jgi:ribonuclease-3
MEFSACKPKAIALDSQGGDGGLDLPWNERLEFLGDAVLGLSVARRLMARTESFAEGELSRIRASMVNEASLAAVARALRLGDYLIMGRGAAMGGGRDRESILADAVESLIGAVFSDAGFDAADQLVGRLFEGVFALDGLAQRSLTDYKTMLQELIQDTLRITPSYDVVSASGPDHDKRFTVRVMIGEKELGRGGGASKKRASQEAAKAALDKMQEARK